MKWSEGDFALVENCRLEVESPWYIRGMSAWARKYTGFTIVELLIVIVVIAILAAITVVAYTGIRESAEASAVQSDLASSSKKLEVAKVSSDTQVYPLTQNAAGLSASGGTVLSYMARSPGAGYCLEGVNGGQSYFITSGHRSPVQGFCEPLAAWLAGSQGEVSGYTIPLSGSSGTTTGPSGGSAYAFNGSQTVQLESANPINLNQGSISVWVNRTGSTGSVLTAGASGATGAVATISSIYIRFSSGELRAGWADGSTNGDFDQGVSNGALTAGQWYHAVLTWAPGAVRLYINGVRQSSSDTFTQNNKAGWEDRIVVGGTLTGPDYSGSLDDVRIFDRVLTDDEIQILYENGAV